MKKALRDWFQTLVGPAQVGHAATASANLTKLVTVKPVPGTGAFLVNATHTSTST